MLPLSASTTQVPASTSLVSVRTRRLRSLVRALEWVSVIAVLAFAALRVLPRAWIHLNTDFPNYYVTAHLLRDGYSTHRVYDWIWLQRQKDHLGISSSEQPVVGFVPHTPFSALPFWPLTYWPPLTAKHIWIVCNLLLLVAVAVLLRSLTQLGWRRLVLLIGLCYPALRNLEYGQYYIVILVLLTTSLYLYVRERHVAAGVVIGVAAGLKIFPVFFLLYFARKRDLRAVMGLIAGILVTVGVSVWAFGIGVHRTYLEQVLPWALRGDAMDPYALSPNSLSALLHKLFIFEPQWNPNPVVHAPALFAIFHPLVQLLILVPAIYLAAPHDRDDQRLQLEWSAFLAAVLTISTLPASYHFTLLILPAAVLAAMFLRERNYAGLTLLLILYVGIGFPAWPHPVAVGWRALLAVPRLYLLLLLCSVFYVCMFRLKGAGRSLRADRTAWAATFTILLALQIVSNIHHQRGLYDRYSERLPLPVTVLSASMPAVRSQGIDFIAMQSDGYTLCSVDHGAVCLLNSTTDQLSHAAWRGQTWVEEADARSDIVRLAQGGTASQEVEGGESPVVSPDGKWLAYLRSNRGRNSLWLRALSAPNQPDKQLTSRDFDVEEVAFVPGNSVIFAAEQNDHSPELYEVKQGYPILPLRISNARYPSISPDGLWLAYSRLDRGVWNLWLSNLSTGQAHRVSNAECNDISPAWEPDSKTLVYATDCGRALWFTALNREQVLP